MKTKKEAVEIGNELRRRLGDKWEIDIFDNRRLEDKWEIDIFDNRGWHVSAKHRFLTVYAHKNKNGSVTYSCLLSTTEMSGTGKMFWSSMGKTYNDPVQAVREQIKIARKFVNQAVYVVESSEDIAKEFTCPCCNRKY